jgi:hypothetical protein
MFKIIAFFMITLFALIYVMVGIFLTYGKHLHNCIISLRGEVWAHITSSSITFLIPVPSQEIYVFVC